MKKITKEQREKMEESIKKIKYRLFQAQIQFASHDHERLKETVNRIAVNARKISRELIEEKKAKKKHRRKKKISLCRKKVSER